MTKREGAAKEDSSAAWSAFHCIFHMCFVVGIFFFFGVTSISSKVILFQSARNSTKLRPL